MNSARERIQAALEKAQGLGIEGVLMGQRGPGLVLADIEVLLAACTALEAEALALNQRCQTIGRWREEATRLIRNLLVFPKGAEEEAKTFLQQSTAP